ncbi:hypothetical protein [Kitasatospora sp. NPDC087315]|uniref:hypothetical protein n=1 Tax=Kitasatospora sp. NPDC087315 TaxID=3364069 RepID=UPI0037F1B76D
MTDAGRPEAESLWPTLAFISWGLVAIAVAGWAAIGGVMATAWADDTDGLRRAATVFLPPLLGPAIGAALAWTAMALTAPARQWAGAMRTALTGGAALLGGMASAFGWALMPL